MIGRLAGRIADEEADGTICLDVGGVGYEVATPLGTAARAATPGGGPGAITLFVHTHVREDAIQLYGFATREERAAFRALIAVSNVGPKIAMALLGALSVHDLGAAIARRDLARLQTVPGVGKRTAERLVVELKDRLPNVPAPAPAARGGAPPTRSGTKEELLHDALTRMGFRAAEAERAVAALADRIEAQPLGELVRDALAILSR